MKLTPVDKTKVRELIAIYPSVRSGLIPVLHYSQDTYGFIDDELMLDLATELNLPVTEIHNTFQFYSMFRKKPAGRHLIEVCTTLSCSLLGADHLIDYLEKRLKIKAGETTADGAVTLALVECLGCCGTAPVMQVNGKFYESLTEAKIDSVLKEIGYHG